MDSFEFEYERRTHKFMQNGSLWWKDSDNEWHSVPRHNDYSAMQGVSTLLRELTTTRDLLAGLEREQAKDAVEWAALCLVHKKEAEAASAVRAEKEAELNEVQAAADSTGILAYKNMKIESIRETNEELCKKVMSLGTENTRLRAECERLLSCVNEAEIGWATDNTEKDDEIERLRAENETIKSKLPSTRQLCNEAYEGDPTLNTWGNQFRR